MENSIESKSNDKIKTAVKLASSSKYRQETGLFFAEGLRLVYDAVITGITPKWFFYTANAKDKYCGKIDEIIKKSKASFLITEAVAEKISETKNNQGIFAVCPFVGNKNEEIENDKKYIALESIQDPANLGSIIRTAEALGIYAAILSNCCDIYNPKAQRASMGSLYRMRILYANDLSELLKEKKAQGMKAFAAVPDDTAESIVEADLSGGVIAVIGNEGNGVTQKIKNECRPLTVPMQGRAESLNASMAAAIVMWEMMRKL